jgi:hypothetical protein
MMILKMSHAAIVANAAIFLPLFPLQGGRSQCAADRGTVPTVEIGLDIGVCARGE